MGLLGLFPSRPRLGGMLMDQALGGVACSPYIFVAAPPFKRPPILWDYNNASILAHGDAIRAIKDTIFIDTLPPNLYVVAAYIYIYIF